MNGYVCFLLLLLLLLYFYPDDERGEREGIDACSLVSFCFLLCILINALIFYHPCEDVSLFST